jgi:signal transduction histidine kinase
MLRRRSIRLRIIVLVLVPVIGLIGLYAEVLNLTVGKVLTLRQEASIRELVALPVANVQRQLASERALALQYLARPGHDDLKALLKQKTNTDAAIRRFGTAVNRALDGGPVAKERSAFLSWQTSLKKVRDLRSSVVSLSLTKIQAAGGYSTIIEGGDNVLNQAIIPVLTGPLGIQAADLLSMTKASQALGEESDLVRADLIAGSFPADELTLINQLAVQHQEQVAATLPDLDPVLRTLFTGIPGSKLGDMESAITAGPAQANQVTLSAWTSAEMQYRRAFRSALLKATKTLADEATTEAKHLVINLLIIAGVGLIAILAAILVGIVVGRGMIRQLNDLKASAVTLSADQLPSAIRRLRAGEDVSVGAEVPQLEPGSDEFGQVRQAFNAAARTAIAAAVDEIKIRQGVNDVFRSLARRNQSLLTRQLQLLDSMERRVHDPEELADLFRVDHMTTRMRRHAEGLLIVAGGSSGRTWREPVPVVDVMRAAAAEVEDYTRVRVNARTSAALAGHAVADVIHLLAELLENAATFSPANTPVRMDSERVGRGVIVEIEDRGLGMSEDQLAAINKTLVDPPLFDLSGSDQLGLFIAGQLGKRHEVRVTLRSSAYGGVTAVVLIPTELVIDTEPEDSLAIASVRELGGRPIPELPGGVLEPALSLAAAAPATGRPGSVRDLDARAVPSEAADAQEIPVVTTTRGDDKGKTPEPAGMPDSPAAADMPSWITEPSTEHSAWPGAVPLVSGPLPASTTATGAAAARATTTGSSAGSTTTGPVAGAPEAGAQATPGRASTGSPALAAAVPGTDAADSPEGPTPYDLPTRRPGNTGLAWGENTLAGGRWAGFPLTGSRSNDAAAPETARTDAWAPATPIPLRPRKTTALPNASPPPTGPVVASPTGAVPPSADKVPPLAEAPRSQTSAAEAGSAPVSTTKAEQVRSAEPPSAELEGLPVRVRQANLAPQLRKATPAVQPGEDEPAPSPEAARSTMAALQLGWQRGRSVTEPTEPVAPLPGEPAVAAEATVMAADDTYARDTKPAGSGDPAADAKSGSGAGPVDDATQAAETAPGGDTASVGDPPSDQATARAEEDTAPAGDTGSAGDTESASGEFRTTPTPKRGRRPRPRRRN